MSALLRTLLLCMPLLLHAQSSGYDDEGGMRWRVFADPATRISFRYPFTYSIPDMYHPGMTRGRASRFATLTGEEAAGLSPEEIRDKLREMLRNPDASNIDYDLELFASAAADLPAELKGKDLGAIASGLAGLDAVVWEPYDYYATSDARPHADDGWAPEGIEALRGEGGGMSALALSYDGGDRFAVVACSGGLGEHDNARILDSIEVMVEKRRQMATWRQAACARGQVINELGQPERPGREENVNFASAWEVETEHYHITSNVSPKHALQYGAMMETLYEAFREIYQPERMPPHKMEIAVLRDVSDMSRRAAEVGVGPLPPGVLGFFSPTLLNIMAYETHEKSGGFSTFRTLAHEASHQFLHVTCNGSEHVPTWINEGIAVYFEAAEYKNGRLSFGVPKDRLDALFWQYSDTGRMLQSPGDYLNHYGHIPGIAYGEVYLMVHFWVFGVRGGKERFQEYWKALLNGEDGTEAFDRVFMADLIKKFGSRGAALDQVEKLMVEYRDKIK